MHIVPLMIFIIMISGCTATYKQQPLTEQTAKLIRGKSVVISTPSNGFYGDEVYSSSGKTTAFEVRTSFARFSNNVTVEPDCKDIACLKTSRSSNSDYYVIPEILHWEERATEWSGIPDQIEIKLSVYDGRSLKELASTSITGESKWATFGGDHPQDLLPDPLKLYVESLY